eukprot:CAMPEP_0118985100 /NCGR_PEP_ID=MMETSP1173-20130426/39190_1 /TAXON_ID=1034831 /ORGANISM="Rhizochromulina marina cf, Strain CCMP1243" /LENGTH=47 /DNA_ID= /DNA_START= /DNA_END= /DNA_ORIENTATION=
MEGGCIGSSVFYSFVAFAPLPLFSLSAGPTWQKWGAGTYFQSTSFTP